MLAKEIKDVLKVFVESGDKSLLIDGPWGCGKTHHIIEFLKEQKKSDGPKCYYMSLFGFDSIKEINNELYVTVNKIKATTQKIINGAFKVASVGLRSFSIPGAGAISDVIDSISYAIGEIDEEKEISIKKCPIIIFDDIERVGENISYKDLLGYISNLYMRGVRFIGVVSSNKMESKRKEEFDDFKEKVFDGYYIINKTDEYIIKDLFSSLNIDNIERATNLVGNNIRRAQKALSFYKKIEKRIANSSYDAFQNYSNSDVLAACVLTIIICFEKEDYEPDTTSSEKSKVSFEEIYFDEIAERFGPAVAKTYMYRKKIASTEDFKLFEMLIDALIIAFIYRDYSEVDSLLFPKEASLLDQLFFLLSDRNKIEYLKTVKGIIDSPFKYSSSLRRPILVFCDKSKTFTRTEANNIANSFATNEEYHDFKSYSRTPQSLVNPDLYYKRINMIFEKKNEIEIADTINKFVNQDYESMTSYLYETTFKDEDNSFTKLLIKHNFFLPDLKGDVTWDGWKYACEVANYVNRFNHSTEFCNYLDRIQSESKRNKSLSNRIKSLKENATARR